MLISIITSAFNTEKYLPFCIDSILSQTYTDLEIILIDDGSVDNTGKICDAYAKKDSHILVFHQNNKGVSDSWNEGVLFARGLYIGFVDADDFIHPRMYEVLYKAIIDTNSDVAYCDFKKIYGDAISNFDQFTGHAEQDDHSLMLLDNSFPYSISSKEKEMTRIFRADSWAYIWKEPKL